MKISEMSIPGIITIISNEAIQTSHYNIMKNFFFVDLPINCQIPGGQPVPIAP